MPLFSLPQLTALRALLDRLIPADDFPGALETGVETYVLRQMAGACASELAVIARGLERLDAEAALRSGGQATFATLGIAERDALLTALEAGQPATDWPATEAAAFFSRMVDLAHEGFYADPSNGGNRAAVAWRMIGYDPAGPGSAKAIPL